MLTASDRRSLLIALNAEPTLPRSAAYTLAQRLDAWVDRMAPVAVLAAELGVPRTAMRLALTVLPSAPRRASREMASAAVLGARVLTSGDPDYPRALYDLGLPPPVLYLRGALPVGPSIAIVGSRRADAYGREAAEWFARELALAGMSIVSGFAHGVDIAAHRSTIEAGGSTVAVLGCGLDVDYPRGRRGDIRRLTESGALLSELPLGAPPLAQHFPIRNRIIAALTHGTLVVQAVARSGSLITARHAMELGRDVYAVPGPIFHERALGPNALIRDGAVPALHPRDILESLPLAVRTRLRPRIPDDEGSGTPYAATEPAARLLRHLQPGEPRAPDSLAAAANLPVEEVLAQLLELELDGRARRHPGPAYSRRVR